MWTGILIYGTFVSNCGYLIQGRHNNFSKYFFFSFPSTRAAYPVLDKRITSTKLAPVSLSDTVCVPCAYQRGRIDDRQQDVVWYKGMDRVNPSVSQFSRYEILRNFTLMIRDVKSSDASDAYYCQVNVTTFNETVTKQAPLISVTVLGNAPYMCIVYIKCIVSSLAIICKHCTIQEMSERTFYTCSKHQLVHQ